MKAFLPLFVNQKRQELVRTYWREVARAKSLCPGLPIPTLCFTDKGPAFRLVRKDWAFYVNWEKYSASAFDIEDKVREGLAELIMRYERAEKDELPIIMAQLEAQPGRYDHA